MGQVPPLPSRPDGRPAPVVIPLPAGQVRPLDSVHCALCGARLSAGALRHHLVSPHEAETITVCHTCHRAARGEGYRPAE